MLWGVGLALLARCTCVSLPGNVEWKCEADGSCLNGGTCVNGYCLMVDGSTPDSGQGDASTGDGGVLPDAGPPPDGGQLDGGNCFVPVVAQVCNDGGWCWERPFPHGNTINGMFAFADDDVWAVGDYGVVTHGNGSQWSPVASPDTVHHFNAVWGPTANDVWIVGDVASVFHWSCDHWELPIVPASGSSLRGVWGNTLGEIIAVGDDGIFHSTAGVWSLDTTAPQIKFNAIWGGLSGLYAVGNGNAVYHRELGQTSWQSIGAALDAGVGVDLSAVWGDSTNVWVAGTGGGHGAVARWHPDAGWQYASATLSQTDFKALSLGPSAVFAAGINGALWTSPVTTDTWLPVTASLSPVDFHSGATSLISRVAWVGGAGGTVDTFAAGSWARQAGGLLQTVYAVWASDAGVMAGVGLDSGVGAFLTRVGSAGAWSVALGSSPGAVKAFAGSGAPASGAANGGLDLWAADDQGQIWQLSSQGTWETVVSLPGFGATGMVEGSDGGTPELWVVGTGIDNFYSVRLPTLTFAGVAVGAANQPLSAIEATSAGVLAVGSEGTGPIYLLFQGGSALLQANENRSLYGVWADPDTNGGTGYAVGAPGLPGGICSGLEAMVGTWSCSIPTLYQGTLWSVWGTSRADVWVTGDQGAVLRYDSLGGPFPEAVGTSNALHAVNGPAAGTERWLVGDYGTILHKQ
jgi:hypothetical protein